MTCLAFKTLPDPYAHQQALARNCQTLSPTTSKPWPRTPLAKGLSYLLLVLNKGCEVGVSIRH